MFCCYHYAPTSANGSSAVHSAIHRTAVNSRVSPSPSSLCGGGHQVLRAK